MNRGEVREYDFHDTAEEINARANPEVIIDARTPFVLLLGASAVGKSEIINGLNKGEKAFEYIGPFTTRELREGEQEKTRVTEEDFQDMVDAGDFIYVKDIYGARYGTPKSKLLAAQEKGMVPILDFPLADVSKLPMDDFEIIPIYVFPRSIQEWYNRLRDNDRNNMSRLRNGFSELRSFVLESLENIHSGDRIAFATVNADGKMDSAVQDIQDFLVGINALRLEPQET